MILAVLVYRATLSRWLGGQCRFHPTCSAYALEAVHNHGAWRGGRLALRRILRCHPWGGSGYDPPPPTESAQTGATPQRNDGGNAAGDRK